MSTIKDNLSLTKLFYSKKISLYIDDTDKIVIEAQPVWRFYEDDDWCRFYRLISFTKDDWKKMMLIDCNSAFEYIVTLITQFGVYKEFKAPLKILQYGFQLCFPDFDFDQQDFINHQLKIGSVILTEEIWDYVVYIIKLISGEKVTQPLTNLSPEARAFYEMQKAQEEKIKQLKAQSGVNSDKEGLLKMFLSISYSFPSLTFDYLFQQTMAQIHWLQTQAAGAVSYNINAQAYAAGNWKKGKKLEFFLK